MRLKELLSNFFGREPLTHPTMLLLSGQLAFETDPLDRRAKLVKRADLEALLRERGETEGVTALSPRTGAHGWPSVSFSFYGRNISILWSKIFTLWSNLHYQSRE
jgi:hypothetical protein